MVTSSTAYKRPESVLVLIYTGTGQVLLMERKQPEGFWQSVTGSLEVDETPQQAAVRELLEETGLEMAVVETGIENRFPILPEWRHRYHPDVVENREYVFTLGLATPCKIRLNPNEHSKYEWLDMQTAMQRCSSWTNRQAIEILMKNAV